MREHVTDRHPGTSLYHRLRQARTPTEGARLMAQGVHASSLPLAERAELLERGQRRLVEEDRDHFLDRETLLGKRRGAALGLAGIGTLGALNLLGDKSHSLLRSSRESRAGDVLADAVNRRFSTPESAARFRTTLMEVAAERLGRPTSTIPVDTNPFGMFGKTTPALSKADIRQLDQLFPERSRVVATAIEHAPDGRPAWRPSALTGAASVSQEAARRVAKGAAPEIDRAARAASALVAEKPIDALIRHAHAPVRRAWHGLTGPSRTVNRLLDRVSSPALTPLTTAARLLNRRAALVPLLAGAAGAAIGRTRGQQALVTTEDALLSGTDRQALLRNFDLQQAAKRAREMDSDNPFGSAEDSLAGVSKAIERYPETVAQALLYAELGMI